MIRPPPHQRNRPGFSLVELVIVVVIIGIIAAIAVPRISSASRTAERNAVQATLANVRNAVDLFYIDHNCFPGFNPSGGGADGQWFVDQLTLYTDAEGNTSDTPGYPFVYGPYLRRPFPVNPLNGLATVAARATESDSVLTGSTGWVATLRTGAFDGNAPHQQVQEVAAEAEQVTGELEEVGLPVGH